MGPDSLVVSSNSTRGYGHKPEHKRFHLNTKKHIIVVWVMEHWKRLSRESTESQRSSKARWTWCWATCSGCLCLSSGVGLDDPQRSLPALNILRFCDYFLLFIDLVTAWFPGLRETIYKNIACNQQLQL